MILYRGMAVVMLSFLSAFVLSASGERISGADSVVVESGIAEGDSLESVLEELEVVGASRQGWKKGASSVWLNTDELVTSARVLGEKDIIGAIKTLPGIAAAGDYGSGIIVDGAEASQTLFMIDGAPVFFPYRFGGVFSTFNSSFFKIVDFERNSHDASMADRLGGLADLRPQYVCYVLKGEINVGLLASSATLHYGRGTNWNISISGRGSYINQLYGRLLKSKELTLSYDFADLNIGGSFSLGKYDRIVGGYFRSHDFLESGGMKYDMETRVKWNNEVGMIGWRHKAKSLRDCEVSLTAFYSGYSSNLELILPDIFVSAPSRISDLGIKGKFMQNLSEERISRIEYGFEVNRYACRPQWCEFEKNNTFSNSVKIKQHFGSYRIYGNYLRNLSNDIELVGGVSTGYFHNEGYRRFYFDPRLSFLWRNLAGYFQFHFGTYHQYLHQTGFSEIGLASDFWSGATEEAPMSKAYNFSIGWNRNIFDFVDVEAEVYYKIVRNSPEYEGVVLDLIETDFNALENIRVANGYNFGLNLKLTKSYNNITGSLSYAFGDGWRHQHDEKYWRSRTSLGSVLRIALTYTPNSHWILNTNFNFSSGRPYTPVKTVYMIAGSAMMEYGIKNSGRLPSNQRLDLSASYVFKTGGRFRLRHILNFTLINAYGHKNVEMQTYILNRESGKIQLKQVYSLYRFLPSLSYTIEL